MARKKSAESKIEVGNIRDVNGEVNISGGDIVKGFTAAQVSILIKQIATTFQVKPFDGHCPYKGLDVFEEEDAKLFFGREKIVDDLVSRVKESRTVFITGPSGSGKSSLVRAGLIPALKNGAIKNSDHWLYGIMKPGRDPIEAVVEVFSRLKSPELGKYFRENANTSSTLYECAASVLSERKDQRLVLFIDQFEEVFTQLGKEADRLAFLNLLTHAATEENGRVILLFSMRSDFVSNCATYPQLNSLLNQQFIQIGSMQSDELVSAIAQPALRVGLRIDPNLIAQIINDMQGEPGALPLMQFALKDLFDSQQAKGGLIALTLNDYLQHGGIHKSLERHADEAFSKLSKEEQELARSIFSGLIEIGRGTQDTKRTALFDELIPANTNIDDVEAIVQKLADARLITTDEQAGRETVTISHEKLIDAWPWLKRLVDENRDIIVLQNEITSDAKEWGDHRREASYLYSGARLANAKEQLSTQKLVLNELAQEFVRAGFTRQRRGQLALVTGIFTVITLLIIAVIIFSRQSGANAQLAQQNASIADTAQAASTLAFGNAATAQANATIARAGELGAESISLRDSEFDTSLLLSLEAFLTKDSVRTRGVLLNAIQSNPQLLQYLRLPNPTVYGYGVAFSPDGKTLATISPNNTIILRDVSTRQLITELRMKADESVRSIAFNPAGQTLASAGCLHIDGSCKGEIIIWDLTKYQPIGDPMIGHTDLVNTIAFGRNGTLLASGSSDKTIILWNMKTRQPVGQPLGGQTKEISSVAFSPDGTLLASGSRDGSIVIWNTETQQPIGKPLNNPISAVTSLAFSRDGETLASGYDYVDGLIILWDMKTHQSIQQLLVRNNGISNVYSDAVFSLAFSPTSETLVSGSLDGSINLWDTTTGQLIGKPLIGNSYGVWSVAFNPDGKTIASEDNDGTVILWDISIKEPMVGYYLTDGELSIAFSPDGKKLAVATDPETILFYDVKTHLPIGQPIAGYIVNSLAFSPDGNILAIGSRDNTVLWNIQMQKPVAVLPKEGEWGINSVAFSRDGKLLATGNDVIVEFWDLSNFKNVGQLKVGNLTSSYKNTSQFSPDGKIFATSNNSGITLWDVKTLQPIGQPIKALGLFAFSPDGKTLVVGGDNITLWNVDSHKEEGKPLLTQNMMTNSINSTVSSVAFSPDGKTFATGDMSYSIILWDATTHEPVTSSLTGYITPTWVENLVFSPDGKTLVSGTGVNYYGEIILWDVDPQSWFERICQRVGRNFTRAEWTQYFPDQPYRATCPQWPLEPEATPTPEITVSPTP